MKKISDEQVKQIMALLQKYNVGVQEFIAVQAMFEKLPAVEEQKEETTKASEKTL